MTEEDFQEQLDANPEDWKTRLSFANWLEERRDPRGIGYRALAIQQRWPHKSNQKAAWWWVCMISHPDYIAGYNDLWCDWFSILPAGEGDDVFWPVWKGDRGIKTRRECEDAAALAFLQLPSERQAELLIPQASLWPPT